MSASPRKVHDVFAKWSLYEKIIHFNYMRHAEMIAEIRNVVSQIQEPLHILDLGCGDGWMASQGLQQANVVSYTGVDLSDAALQSAKQNLSSVTGDISLNEASILEYLKNQTSSSPNLILASYSLHHYQEATQPEIINYCAEILQSEGSLIWIDLCRHQGESREDYLHRFWTTTLPHWNELTDEEVQEVKDHMQSSDFPLSADERVHLATVGDFKSVESLYRDEFYSADYFAKS